MISVVILSTVMLLLVSTTLPMVPVAAQAPEFTEAATGLPTEGDFSHISLADMDKDGNNDIIAGADSYGDVDTHGLYVWTGNGAGSWTKRSSGLPTTENFGGIGINDIDKDGDLDIVAGYETWSGSEGKGIGVWLGNGGSGGLKFTEGTVPIDNGGYDSANLADVNKDGFLDILGGSRGKGIKVWLGDGGNSWTEASDGLPTSGEYTGVTAGDVDKDGDLDIAAGNYNGNGLQVWLRGSDGSWTEASTGLIDRQNTFCVVFADMDKDGNLDLVGTVRDQGVFVYTGNGGAGGSVEWTEATDGLPTDQSGDYQQVSVGDMDADGDLDIVAARAKGGIYVWKGNGGAGGALSFTEASGNLPTSGTFYGAAFGKIDNDAVLDIVGATWNTGIKAWTASLGPADETPPSSITDLKAQAADYRSVRLTWTAPGDDGTTGTATRYDIRYSSSGIKDMTDFESAFEVENEPTPKQAGSSESFTVTGLSGQKTYHFAIIAYDDGPNPSSLSNIVQATTPEAPAAPNPPTVSIEDPQVGSVLKGTVTLTIAFTDQDDDVNELEIYIDGAKVHSATGVTSPTTWQWDTKDGDHKVKDGEHTVKVVVMDQSGHTDTSEVAFKVKNKKPTNGDTPGFEAVMLFAALAIGLAAFRRHRKAD